MAQCGNHHTEKENEKSIIADLNIDGIDGKPATNSDAENTVQGSAKQPWRRRAWRPFIHAIIWLLFTG
jgi:hypothetical protein